MSQPETPWQPMPPWLPVADRLPDVRRIAVLRANAVGDYVQTIPALDALRAAYPAAEIVLVGAPWHAEFLTGRPGPVDRVVVAPTAEGVRDPTPAEPEDAARLDDFFAAMKEEELDLAVQLHGGGRRSNPFTVALGARFTAGLRARDAPALDRTVPYETYQHEVMRFLEVAAVVGAPPVTLAPQVRVTDADRVEAAGVLAELDRPFVVLHPGAKDSRRRWPTNSFARVGRGLLDAGAAVAVTGTGDERDVVEDVVSRLQGGSRVVAVVGALGLGGLAALLEAAAVVVSNDTGPRHLAGAVGTATVGIFWCVNLMNAGPLTRTSHRPHVSWQMECPVCGVPCMAGPYPTPGAGRGCEHDDSFVAAVPPEPVLADALDLLRIPPSTHH